MRAAFQASDAAMTASWNSCATRTFLDLGLPVSAAAGLTGGAAVAAAMLALNPVRRLPVLIHLPLGLNRHSRMASCRDTWNLQKLAVSAHDELCIICRWPRRSLADLDTLPAIAARHRSRVAGTPMLVRADLDIRMRSSSVRLGTGPDLRKTLQVWLVGLQHAVGQQTWSTASPCCWCRLRHPARLPCSSA